jgi:hypothetical protein
MKAFIVILVAAALGWYAYKALTGAGDPETCAEAYNHCIKTCRQTTSDAAASQACQEACKRDQAACKSK